MDLLLLIIFLLINAAFGMRILRLFRFNFEDFKEKIAFSISIGLGLIAYLVFISGLAGLLYKWYLISLLIVLAMFSFSEIVNISKRIFGYLVNIRLKNFTLYEWLFLIFVFIAIIFTLLGALAPPTGNDSLAYRLVHVRIFSEIHRLSYIPYTRESLWPYLIEMLFTLGMVIKSDIFVKLIAWSFGVLSAFLIYTFTKEYFSKLAGYISSAIFLLTPAIFTQMTYAYVDIPLACYSFASFISLLKYFRSRDIKWAFLAGAFCGFTLSIKYIGVISLLSLLAMILYNLLKENRVSRAAIFKATAFFLLAGLLFSFCWYFRSYIIKGNPVYPFFTEFFAGSGWKAGLEYNIGRDFSISGLVRLPWDITMLPDNFGGEHLGLMYLLFLPLVFRISRSKDMFKSAGVFIIFYVSLWFFVDRYVIRFLFPILLPFSVLVGEGIRAVFSRRGFFSKIIRLVFVLICLLNTGFLVYYNLDKVKVAVGLESKAEYLSRTERTYNLTEYINKNLPLNATILMAGEIRTYYIARPYLHLKNLIEEEKILSQLLEKKEFLKELKKYNVDYLLWQKEETAAYPWLQYLADNNTPVFSCDFIDKDGRRFNYELYRLSED